MAPTASCDAKCGLSSRCYCAHGDILKAPPSHFPTSTEVRQESRKRSFDIFQSWNTLNTVLSNFEEILHKRWLKKSQEQRKAILVTAYPDIPLNHRPDIEGWRKEWLDDTGTRAAYRDAYLCPYINVGDLVQGKRLLFMLHARGRNLPHEFCLADWNAAHLGLMSHALRTGTLTSHTMLLYGKTTQKTYGQLFSWEDKFEAKGWLQSQIGFLPGHGLLLLEIQQRVLHFLVQCCKLILHDQKLDDLTHPSALVQPLFPATASDDNDLSSLPLKLAEAPYTIPMLPEFKRLEIMIAAKRSAAEDHYWSMKEDPSYFEDVMNSYASYDLSSLDERSDLVDRSLENNWKVATGPAIIDAHERFLVWDTIYEQMLVLTAHLECLPVTVSHNKDLPVDLRRHLQGFRTLLAREMNDLSRKVRRFMPLSPELKHLFCLMKTGEVLYPTLKVKKDTNKDPLIWIHKILSDAHMLLSFGYLNVIEELEWITQKDPKQRCRLSPVVAQTLSELHVMAEARRQLSLFHPCVSLTVEKEDEHNQEDYVRWIQETLEIIERIKSMGDPALDLGNPRDGRFDYPVSEPRTRETTEAMQKAERNLDEFWADFDSFLYNNTGPNSAKHAMLYFLSDETRQIRRTPEWLAAEGHNEVLNDSADQGDRSHEAQKFSPEADTPSDSIKMGSPTPLQFTPRSSSLPKRILKTLNILFPSTTLASSATPQSLPFPSFLSALTTGLGFDAYKLHFGCWIFVPWKEPAFSLSQIRGSIRNWSMIYSQQPKDRLRERRAAIMFYEPWLAKDICAKDLRTMRRRLEWYGFTRDMVFDGDAVTESKPRIGAGIDDSSIRATSERYDDDTIDLVEDGADPSGYAPDPRNWRAAPPECSEPKRQTATAPDNSAVFVLHVARELERRKTVAKGFRSNKPKDTNSAKEVAIDTITDPSNGTISMPNSIHTIPHSNNQTQNTQEVKDEKVGITANITSKQKTKEKTKDNKSMDDVRKPNGEGKLRGYAAKDNMRPLDLGSGEEEREAGNSTPEPSHANREDDLRNLQTDTTSSPALINGHFKEDMNSTEQETSTVEDNMEEEEPPAEEITNITPETRAFMRNLGQLTISNDVENKLPGTNPSTSTVIHHHLLNPDPVFVDSTQPDNPLPMIAGESSSTDLNEFNVSNANRDGRVEDISNSDGSSDEDEEEEGGVPITC
ncbi:MAG: hypothetical protein MMC33_002857 [Icmadophila ericetorum]|nr:hypothetical protein [Icmadophila ericetorum]